MEHELKRRDFGYGLFTENANELGKIVQKMVDEGLDGQISVSKTGGKYLVTGISQGELYTSQNALNYAIPNNQYNQ